MKSKRIARTAFALVAIWAMGTLEDATGGPLQPLRTTVFHQRTNFDTHRLFGGPRTFDISDDGSTIVYAYLAGNTSELYAMNFDGSHVRLLDSAPGYFFLDVSPDGQQVAWASRNALRIAHLDGSPATQVGGPSDVYTMRVAGGEVFFAGVVNDVEGVYAIRTDGTNLRTLTTLQNLDKWADPVLASEGQCYTRVLVTERE